MSNTKWTTADIPDQTGKHIIITGATSGLGKEATKVLAQKNAKVIMAVRNTEKATKVVQEIQQEVPKAQLDVKRLDLGSLESVRSFTKAYQADYSQLDVLINNAGVMMCPYSKTEDGLEIQMGVNHFGHFALTGLLLPLLKSTPHSRVVATASIAHKSGDIDFSDINWESRKYSTTQAYSDSKIANLYFTHELARKLEGDPTAPLITAAHPGWTKTDLDRHSGLAQFLGNIIAQKVDKGTLPTLRAAVDENAKPGNYYGPKGFMEMKGYPVLVAPNKLAKDQSKAQKLWDISVEFTGVNY